MNLTDRERAENREALSAMNPIEKIEYIFTYYKFPLVLLAVALIAIGSVIYIRLTHKDALLYAAYVNVSVGDTLDQALGEGFVLSQGANPRRSEVVMYRGLYLSPNASVQNHEYAYASRLKTLAAMANQQLDVLLMNREGYDVMSGGGYLLPLDALLQSDAALYARVSDSLTENDVILEDNAIEYNLSEADAYSAVTESVKNGLRVSDFPLFGQAGFSGEVYLGVIGNTPRAEQALHYIEYLTAAPAVA